MKEEEKPARKYPAKLPWGFRGNRSVIVFVTVCTKAKRPILANHESHEILLKAWSEADSWGVGLYTILPDHVHFFCAPAGVDSPNVKQWVKYWKARVTRHWPRPEEKPLWQRDCWDRQMRRADSYREKWEYVRHNPVRHGLVEEADDWPYQGELNPFIWRDA